MMIISKNSILPTGGMRGSIHAWERGLDPWHRDAFPDFAACAAPNQDDLRSEGWYAIDGHGNVIGFLADGAEFPDEAGIIT